MDNWNPNRLRDTRVRRGYTQAALARALDTHERQIVRWERGESRPRPRAVVALAKCLGVPADYLRSAGGDAVSIESIHDTGEKNSDAAEASKRREAEEW